MNRFTIAAGGHAACRLGGRRAVRGTLRIRVSAIGCPSRRSGRGGGQPYRAAIRHPRLRRPDGARVRRPPWGGQGPDAVDLAAGERDARRCAGIDLADGSRWPGNGRICRAGHATCTQI